ncbi:lipopolysaccharide-induced tumor necrosis factor-alpha factor homolog [Clavelina lepadiformis]|uniref:lipopolysaccharide-induced tumor necrosis factor-alpha factor homolog n=1 Tax=Clavelina lepadiformis TaxID=159417 RepID=UPI004043185E
MQPNYNLPQQQVPPPPYFPSAQPVGPTPHDVNKSGGLPIPQTFPGAPVYQQPGPVPTAGPQTNVIINQPPPVPVQHTIIQTSAVALGRASAALTCSSCQRSVTTKVSRSLKSDAWICCVLLCLCGCELCFWIPFVMDSNYITRHSCPACNAHLGSSM